MKEFDLLDPSHIIFASICIAIIIFLPRLFVGKSNLSKNILILLIIGLMLINHGMDFYKEGYLVMIGSLASLFIYVTFLQHQ